MNPNNFNDQEKPVPPTEALDTGPKGIEPNTSTGQSGQYVQPQTTTQFSKKSNKKLFVIIGIIVAVFIVALAGYFVYSYYNPTAKTTGTKETSSAKTTTINEKDRNPTVTAASAILTDNVTGESVLTNTNDTSVASDVSNAAGNVGDSINENNF